MSEHSKLLVGDRSHSPEFGGELVLDADALHALCEIVGDDYAEFLAEIIDVYLEDADERLLAIEPAVEQCDWEAVGKVAHALKSASANVGAVAFANVCGRVEAAARSGSESDLLGVIELLRGMYAEVDEALRGMKTGMN